MHVILKTLKYIGITDIDFCRYMPKFSNVSQDELNKTLFLIAQYTHAEFGVSFRFVSSPVYFNPLKTQKVKKSRYSDILIQLHINPLD